MKKFNFGKLLMLTALPLALAFTSCNDKEENSDTPVITINGETSKAIELASNSGTSSVTLVSNHDWEAVAGGEYEWITLSQDSGSAGETQLTISVIENESVSRRTATYEIKVPFNSTSVKAATLTVVQLAKGDVPVGDMIYYETVGTEVSKDGDYWPYVDAYTGWVRQGSVSQSAVTYTGSSASVRNSGSTWDPGDTAIAGAPYVYIANGGTFNIGSVATAGETNFTFTFAAQHTISSAQNESGAYVPETGEITSSLFGFYAGFNGTDFAKVDFSVNSSSDNGWQIVTVEFKVPEGTSTLYFRFTDFSAGSGQSMRFDEFKLTEGGNGELINPGGVIPPDTDDIYYETVGTAVSKVSGSWPWVDQYTGWVRQGTVDQSAVTYTGSSASVRNSGATWEPSDNTIAAAPYVYVGNGGNFVIGSVATASKTNFTFTFATQYTISSSQNESGSYVPETGEITTSLFGLLVGFNGTDYADVNFTVDPASDNGWQQVTAEFKVPEGTSTLYFKYDGFAPGSGQSIRFDEIRLFEGGNGSLINPGGGGTTDNFTVSPTTASVGAAAGSVATITVTSNVDWTASLSSTAFAALSAASGSNNGTLTVTFDENTTTESRNVVLTVSTTADVTPNSYTVTITQEAPGVPVKFFEELFGDGNSYGSGNRPKIAAMTDWTMGAPITYTDSFGRADIRSTANISPSVWFPAISGENTVISELVIGGIDQLGTYTSITLSYDIASNTATNATNNNNAGHIEVSYAITPGTYIPLLARTETFSAANTFITIADIELPDGVSELRFYYDSNNGGEGYRVDNVILMGVEL